MQDPQHLAIAIYYTFSTIAQTLAGAVGLLAAFAVLRLSSLDQLLREEIDRLKAGGTPGWSRRGELLSAASTGQYAEFLDLFRKQPGQEDPPDGVSRLLWAETLLKRRKNAYSTLRGSLAVTASAILASVIVLSTAPWLAEYPCLGIVLLFASGCIVLVCLLFYLNTISVLLST